MSRRLAAALALMAVAGAGCGREEPPAPGATGPVSASASAGAPAGAAAAGDAERGQRVWLGQCVACHNPDPTRDGPVGPAVKGASRALLEARVLRGDYPPGYTPRRTTRVMPPRPDLAAAIPDLAAYLR
jgi:mono/diheme cytochrome c family protein